MWAEGPPSEQHAPIGSALRLGHRNIVCKSVVRMKGPSPCEPFGEPSAVTSCEEKVSAKPSPENKGSPEGSHENQGLHEPSIEHFSSHEGSHEGSKKASGKGSQGLGTFLNISKWSKMVGHGLKCHKMF